MPFFATASIPIIVTHAVTFIVGVMGNVVVIFTWTRKGQLRSQTAVFLVSLAVADLLLLVVYVPLEMVGYFVVTWDESGIICKISSYVENLSGMATVLNLVAVSIERFLVIVYPIRARSFCTVSRSRKGLICVWVLALVLALPILYTKVSTFPPGVPFSSAARMSTHFLSPAHTACCAGDSDMDTNKKSAADSMIVWGCRVFKP